MLLEKLKEVQTNAVGPNESNLFNKIESNYDSFSFFFWKRSVFNDRFKLSFITELLKKEIDEKEQHDYAGVHCDSDLEYEDDSDEEYFSDTEVEIRKKLKYDIDTMFEIIYKRDFNKWSLSSIHNRWTQISKEDYGRVQIHR